ncbi:hypothetical protein FOA52_011150 [Chlamydomonas sp. UWO 241]|nr:hypothetical protein FOA52_011150 [Chlamydomonas sp. UWO 241]
MDALWSSLDVDDKRALRLCCTAMRDAVDAHASGLEGQVDAPVLSPTTCSRLVCVNTLTLRSMACLRGMLVETPQPGEFFPRLQSLRLILHEGGTTIEGAADYQAVANAAPWLTQLSMRPPVSATALSQKMSALLSAFGKLEDLALPLVNLRILKVECYEVDGDDVAINAVSELAPLAAMVNMQSLIMHSCFGVTELSPLIAMRLDMWYCTGLYDLALLTAMVKLQRLDMRYCTGVTNLSPLAAMVSTQSLNISGCTAASNLAPLGAMLRINRGELNGR